MKKVIKGLLVVTAALCLVVNPIISIVLLLIAYFV